MVVDFNGGGDALVKVDALLTPDQAIGIRVAARLLWGIGAEQLRTYLANMLSNCYHTDHIGRALNHKFC